MSDGAQEKELIELISKCMLIKDIKEYEKSKINLILNFFMQNNINNLSNLCFIGNGTYSKVFKINEFVIKIGLAKTREKIIESPYIAEEFMRLNIKFVTLRMTIVVGFEIQLLAQKYEKEKEEDLYRLYFSLRQEHLIWTDIKYENIGILNNDLVVVDTDYIFYENDFNITWITPLSKLFEERYRNEERRV